jgi:hypothetical protein
MKHLHKFFSKQDLPWVKLIWEKYYSNGKLPEKTNKGSFWWSGVLKLQSTYKGITQAQMGLGDTIFFWYDLWNGQILKLSFHELHSYAINGSISVISVLNLDSLQLFFHLPLSVQAFDQLCDLDIMLQSIHVTEEKDICPIFGGTRITWPLKLIIISLGLLLCILHLNDFENLFANKNTKCSIGCFFKTD